MSISASQCGRSCSESGWTLYLDESSSSGEKCKGVRGRNEETYRSRGLSVEEDGEENLSMISDASSGPPYCELEECSNEREFDLASSGKTKKKAGQPGRKELNSYEDTATSFRMSCTKKKQGSLSKHASKGKDYSSSHGKSYSKPMQKDGLHFRK